MQRLIPADTRSCLLKEQLLYLLLLVFIIPFPVTAQQQEKTTDRVNACFSASRTETGENLCLYYNHVFSYYLTYGAVDQYARGSYRCSNDTIYLNSKGVRSFAVTAGKNEAIPNGKIKLVFNNPGNNASYISWAAGDAPLNYVDKLKQNKKNYSVIITRPTGGRLSLQHALYDQNPADYPLDKNKNEFSIALSDSLGSLAFDNRAFVWEGNALRSADIDNKIFRMAASTPLSFDEMHWDDSEPKPSKEAFEAWSRQQEDLFSKRAAAALAMETAKEQKLKTEMMRHLETDWLNAVKKATRDTVAIVLLLGTDSIQHAAPDTAADGQLPAAAMKTLAEEYYDEFRQSDYEDNKQKIPVFCQLAAADTTLQKMLHIELLPAVVILTPGGVALFKNEGTLPAASRVKDYYQDLMKARQKLMTDSLITAFNNAPKDSAYLVKMIDIIEHLPPGLMTGYNEAGISVGNLLDTLIEKHVAPLAFNRRFYDFAAEKYFPERWLTDYYATEHSHQISPSLHYMVNHFSSRQKDNTMADRIVNDSLVMKTYFNLSSALSIEYYSAATDLPLYTGLLQLNKQLITGNKPYADFFTSIFYFDRALGLLKFGKSPAADLENDINNFLANYAGGTPVTTAGVDAAAKKLFSAIVKDSNLVFLRTYFLMKPDEVEYTKTYETVIGHVLTLQAVAAMAKSEDSLLSRTVLQKTAAIKQLELAASLSALPYYYLLKRNYAYALYETGNAAGAIALLQEVVKLMEDKSNRYMAGEERTRRVKDDLQKMKAGKKVSINILDMASY